MTCIETKTNFVRQRLLAQCQHKHCVADSVQVISCGTMQGK